MDRTTSNRTTSIGKRLRRVTVLVVLAVALVAALMPTAAFASSKHGYAPHQSYSRYSYQGRHNHDKHYNKYDNHRHDDGRYDKHRHDAKQQHKRCDTSYRVRSGDTLTKIARHYRTSVYALAKANGIRNVNRIVAGQVLCIR